MEHCLPLSLSTGRFCDIQPWFLSAVSSISHEYPWTSMNKLTRFVLSTPQETLIATVVMDDWMEKCSFKYGFKHGAHPYCTHRVADLWPLPILLAPFRLEISYSANKLQPLKHPNMASYILSKLYFKPFFEGDSRWYWGHWFHSFLECIFLVVPSCSLHVNNIFLHVKNVCFFACCFFWVPWSPSTPSRELALGRCKTFAGTSPGGPPRKKPSTWRTKLGWRHPTWCLGPAVSCCIQENQLAFYGDIVLMFFHYHC